MRVKINKLKNYMNKYRELKNNIMQLFWIFSFVGNNKEDNGSREKIRIKRNYKTSNKKWEINKDNGRLNKNIFRDKLIKEKFKIKNYSLSLNKCKAIQID